MSGSRGKECILVIWNHIEIPRANVAKCLGLHLDSKMTWKVHIAKKKEGDGYKNLKNILVSWEILIPLLRKQVTPL